MASPLEKHPVFGQTYVIMLIHSCQIVMEKNALGKAKEKQVRPQRKEDISQTQMKSEFY